MPPMGGWVGSSTGKTNFFVVRKAGGAADTKPYIGTSPNETSYCSSALMMLPVLIQRIYASFLPHP